MEPDDSLETLMTRYQAGDFAAASSLIDLISPRLRQLFGLQAASRPYADDLLQETWLRIHRVRRTYRPGEPVLPWFYAIARRVRVDHYRKTMRTTAREEPLEETTAAAADAPRADELEELLAPLSPSQREVIEMLKVAGMSLEEVARATSSTVGAVKQKVHRAYGKLRRSLFAAEPRKGSGGAVP